MLHGYLRARGELQDRFYLNRSPLPGQTSDAPFSDFVPADRGVVPAGGCSGDAGSTAACSGEALSYANMRLRLEPEFHLSDNVGIHTMIDVFDNMVLGSGATGFSPGPVNESGIFSSTLAPPGSSGSSNLSDSIRVRRAWGRIRDRTLGELRFGRMGWHWGLGMFANEGAGIDSDYSTDVDRLMGITKLAGFEIAAGYDFPGSGLTRQRSRDAVAIPLDAMRSDDLHQFNLSVQRKMNKDEQVIALDRGDVVLNAGLLINYRTQKLTSNATADQSGTTTPQLARVDSQMFMPNLWAQLLYRKMRIETEAMLSLGSVRNTSTDSFTNNDYSIKQFGLAIEGEYRLMSDKLGLHFHTGYASGDPDVRGLSAQNGLASQNTGNRNISTFLFHPNYRVDLILWRNIFRQIAGAYYFRPGISYDFIKNPYGKLLGGRLDVIWSRAMFKDQAYGDGVDLGVELNASVYFRSEDGPELWDGFHAMLQYGMLLPMSGLGYKPGQFTSNEPDTKMAQTLRLVLGVMF